MPRLPIAPELAEPDGIAEPIVPRYYAFSVDRAGQKIYTEAGTVATRALYSEAEFVRSPQLRSLAVAHLSPAQVGCLAAMGYTPVPCAPPAFLTTDDVVADAESMMGARLDIQTQLRQKQLVAEEAAAMHAGVFPVL